MAMDERLIDPNDRSFRSVKAYSIFHLIVLTVISGLSWPLYKYRIQTLIAQIWVYCIFLWIISHYVLTVFLFLRKRWAALALAMDTAPTILYLVYGIFETKEHSGWCCFGPCILALIIYEGLLVVCYRNAKYFPTGVHGFEPIMKKTEEKN